MEECFKVLLKRDFLKSKKKNSRKASLSGWSKFKPNPPKAANQAEQTRLWIKANSCEFQVNQWLIAAPQGLEELPATKLSNPKCKLTHPVKSCWTSTGVRLKSIHRIPDKLAKFCLANLSSRIWFKGVIQISLIPLTVSPFLEKLIQYKSRSISTSFRFPDLQRVGGLLQFLWKSKNTSLCGMAHWAFCHFVKCSAVCAEI